MTESTPALSPAHTAIEVAIPGVPSYPVSIGTELLGQLQSYLRAAAGSRRFRPFLITSFEIWQLWSAAVLDGFKEGPPPTVLFVPSGETHKRLQTVETLLEQLAEAGADRDALLVAFGGGVLGDITGFVASIYMRGVPFVQVPTTLLAQVDSSVGGKTGVNLRAGKNLAGSFHHPLAVVADVEVLQTLPDRELRAGMQEVVKAAMLASNELFVQLEGCVHDGSWHEPATLGLLVVQSVRIKAEVVAADERESGRRMTLNLGHTLGHAIEAVTGYQVLLHGEAVGWGLLAALHLARQRGRLAEMDFARARALVLAFGPLPLFHAAASDLVARSSSDKKHRGGRRRFVLPVAIGSVEVVEDVTQEELLAATEAMLREVEQEGVPV